MPTSSVVDPNFLQLNNLNRPNAMGIVSIASTLFSLGVVQLGNTGSAYLKIQPFTISIGATGTLNLPLNSYLKIAGTFNVYINGSVVYTATYTNESVGFKNDYVETKYFTTPVISIPVPTSNSTLEIKFSNETSTNEYVICSLNSFVKVPRIYYNFIEGNYTMNSTQFFCIYGQYGLLVDNTGIYRTTDGGVTLTPIT